jgi:ankyrin repeat protein
MKRNKLPIHVACILGDYDLVKYLVDKSIAKNGKFIEQCNGHAQTEIELCLSIGQYDIFHWLLTLDPSLEEKYKTNKHLYSVEYKFFTNYNN